jgi:hypothetical protein
MASVCGPQLAVEQPAQRDCAQACARLAQELPARQSFLQLE